MKFRFLRQYIGGFLTMLSLILWVVVEIRCYCTVTATCYCQSWLYRVMTLRSCRCELAWRISNHNFPGFAVWSILICHRLDRGREIHERPKNPEMSSAISTTRSAVRRSSSAVFVVVTFKSRSHSVARTSRSLQLFYPQSFAQNPILAISKPVRDFRPLLSDSGVALVSGITRARWFGARPIPADPAFVY